MRAALTDRQQRQLERERAMYAALGVEAQWVSPAAIRPRVDPVGCHCLRWKGRDKTKCDTIVPANGSYPSIRDGEVRGKISIHEGNSSDL
jgi:hypothetical protein